VNAGLIIAPVLPGITDDVRATRRAVRRGEARPGHGSFMPGRCGCIPLSAIASCRSSQNTFPTSYRNTAERMRDTGYAPRDYAKALSRRIEKLRKKHGFKNQSAMFDRYRPAKMPVQGELELRGRPALVARLELEHARLPANRPSLSRGYKAAHETRVRGRPCRLDPRARGSPLGRKDRQA